MSIGKNVGYNLAGSVIVQVVTLAAVPAYLSLIGTERFGILSIAWLLLGYFGLFDLGLGRATAFRVATQRDADPAELAETFWSAILVNLAMGVIGGLILWAAGYWYFSVYFSVAPALKTEILAALPLLAASLPVALLMGVLSGALEGRERFLDINKAVVVSTILFQLIPLILAWSLGPNLSFLLLGALLGRAYALVALWFTCRREVTGGRAPKFSRAAIRQLLGYGGWVSATALFSPLLAITDRLVIGSVMGANPLAYYSVAFQIAKRIAIVPSALGSAVFPRMTATDDAEARHLARRSLSALVAILLPVAAGAILVLEPFLNLWVGNKLSGLSAPTGRVLILAYWLSSITIVPYTRLQSSGRPGTVLRLILIQLPFYLGLMWLGLTWFGLVGCAAALVLRFLADFLMQSWAADRGFAGALMLAEATAILIACILVCTVWALFSWQWWLAAAMLMCMACASAWRHSPRDLRTKLAIMIREHLPVAGRGH